MKKISKKKQLTIVILIAIVIVISAVFAAVYSNKSVKNNFVPAQVSVSVIENGNVVGTENELPFGNGKAEKRVQIKNSGTGSNSADEYVRVCIFPKFVNNSDEDIEIFIPYTIPETITDTVFTIGDVTFTLDNNWTDNWLYIDGYFYYKGSLSPGDTTPNLLVSVSMDTDKLNSYRDMGALLRVSILADAIQTVGGAVEARWAESGLKSNDVARPKEVSTTAYQAFQSVVSDTVVTPQAAVVTEYQLAQARAMITKVFITDYRLDDIESSFTDELSDDSLSVNSESEQIQEEDTPSDDESFDENSEDEEISEE